jgi:signal transduction histidine kinase
VAEAVSTAQLEARAESTRDPRAAPQERVDALVALAWHLRLLDPGRAHELAAEARELAKTHDYPLGQARAARTMAMSIRSEDQLRNMFALAHEAKTLFDACGDDVGRAASRDFLSSIYEHVGDLSTALDLALDALSIARRVRDPTRIGYALASVGGILAASGQEEVAIQRLEEGLALFEVQGDELGINSLCSRLARVTARTGRPEEALGYAERCRVYAQETGDDWGVATALVVMATVRREQGRIDEAERLYRQALGSLRTEPARWFVGVDAQLPLAEMLLERGEREAGRRELENALDAVRGNDLAIVMETAAREALADLDEREGRFESAVAHLRAAKTLRDRIAQSDARNKLAQVELRAEMDAAKKDAEIHRLRYVELHAMQSKLVESERMAMLGKLAAGTAHELNSPLGVLRSNLTLTRSVVDRIVALIGDHPELGEKLSRLRTALAASPEPMERALARIAEISQSFLRFSQLDQADRRVYDVRDGLESALSIMAPTIRPGVNIERRLAEVPAVDAWPRELNHAFMTVLQNAVQAIEGEGTVTVETESADRHVVVRIRDSGRGMNADQLAGLFDVSWAEDGVRTKMRLGLSAAYATMQKHGGTIHVDSHPGRGTTVTFRIPVRASGCRQPAPGP